MSDKPTYEQLEAENERMFRVLESFANRDSWAHLNEIAPSLWVGEHNGCPWRYALEGIPERLRHEYLRSVQSIIDDDMDGAKPDRDPLEVRDSVISLRKLVDADWRTA